MDRICVPLWGWNWHAMYLWLLAYEFWPYLGKTSTSLPSGITAVQNHSLGGHSHLPSHCGKLESAISYLFSILTDWSNNARSNPYKYKAWSACTCPWGHAAQYYCWSCWSDSCYCKLHPPEVPGKSTGFSRKTTPCQDRVLLRMVWQDPFINALALTAWMRNLHGERASRKTINARHLSRGYCAYRPTRKTLLTTNHRRLCLLGTGEA